MLSKDYGFRIKACRPYRAKTKRKVERFNHYLKNSFITPLMATLNPLDITLDAAYANNKISAWLQKVAHQRIHGTTGEKPQILLNKEKAFLSKIPVMVETAPETLSPVVPPTEVIQHCIEEYDQYMEAL